MKAAGYEGFALGFVRREGLDPPYVSNAVLLTGKSTVKNRMFHWLYTNDRSLKFCIAKTYMYCSIFKLP